MYSPSDLSQRIEQALRDIAYPSQPQGLYTPIQYALEAGGKRLRPTLLLLVYSLFREDIERALPAALGIETYHNHTLLHDDLMDHAEMRRGRPTVHRKWNANTAILSGDTMLIQAYRLVLHCHCEQQQALLEVFARTTQEVCEGQQYDMNFETRTDVTVDEYLEMIRLKTAVLLACAAQMGAIAANAPADVATALYRFTEKIGMAFQLQDDYLDVYGDARVFGKKIGGDILCAKKTFLLLTAAQRADTDTRRQLFALLDDTTLADAEKIAAVTDIYNSLGVADITRQAIEAYYNEARALLQGIDLPEDARKALWQFAAALLGRKS